MSEHTRDLGTVSVSVEYDADPDDTVATFQDVRERYAPDLREKPQEHLYALFLDASNRLITDQLVTKGAADKVAVDRQAIVRTACLVNAQGVIVVHNHPSGDPTPSEQDIDVTEDVGDALDAVGVELLDHVIIGDDAYSFRQNGHM